MKMLRFILLVSSLLTWNVQLAQQVYAQVSSKRVQVGVPFEYAVVASVNVSNITPPAFRDFEIVSGPNQSSSVQYANGVMSQQLIVSFALVARKEGKFSIGPAIIMSGNQRFETSAITIEVVKGQTGQGGQEGQTAAGGDDLFIRTSISKNRFYLGEQVIIIQKVYSRSQIIGYQKSVPPTYDGFYSQPLESPTKGQLVMENVDGVNYYTHELFRTAIVANKSGRITISPIEVVPVIRRQSAARPKSLLEQFFGGAAYEDVQVPVSSRPLVVDVLPLPEEGKPESFNGAVGSFSARAELNRSEVKANDAVNLKVTVSGRGNLKLVNAPPLKMPEDFETYEPRVSENAAGKTFDYLLIPRKAGEYSIADLDFSYFNLDTRKYVSIPFPAMRIKVLPPDPGSAGAQVYVPRNQVKETENDIRYIKKGDFTLTRKETEFFNSPLHLLLLVLPVTGLGIALVARRNYLKKNADVAQVRERRAARMARKQLARAESLMKHQKRDEFYAEILVALNNYLSYKLNIPAADLSRDSILRALGLKRVPEEMRHRVTTALDAAEFARYAPGAAGGSPEEQYRQTASLIMDLEQQLNRKPAA